MVEKAKACGLKFREAGLGMGSSLAPDPLAKLHDSYAFPFNVIDWCTGRFHGTPRAYDGDPSYGETVSNIARDRFRLKSDDPWPPTFLPELPREPTPEKGKVHDVHP